MRSGYGRAFDRAIRGFSAPPSLSRPREAALRRRLALSSERPDEGGSAMGLLSGAGFGSAERAH
jgi:hypothetical protein